MRSNASSQRSRWLSSDGLKAALASRIGLWMLWPILLSFAALATVFAGGCSRTVLVSESSPIRIGPATEARVYTRQDGDWVLSPNRVTIPEGWYCVPPSFVETDQ